MVDDPAHDVSDADAEPGRLGLEVLGLRLGEAYALLVQGSHKNLIATPRG